MFTMKSLIFLLSILLSMRHPFLTKSLPTQQEVLCDADDFPDVCPEIYDPVCIASPKQCFTTPCYQTDEISSACEACKTEGAPSYTPGKCQYTCDAENLPPPGTEITSGPVCAIYQDDCQDSSCRATFDSSTLACQDGNVLSFSLGACPEEDPIPPELQEVVCAVALFPAVCPDVYEPVCVDDPKDCITTPCYQTEEISNGCEACKTEGVQSYLPGKCQYTCNAGNLPPSGTGITSGPVCAIYQEYCQDASCRTTFDSSTLACQDDNVLSFSLGACPDEEPIPPEFQEVRCALVLFPRVCPRIYEPVCVDDPKVCITTPCYQTREISNGCEACKTKGVHSYIPGKCQYTCDPGNLPPLRSKITSSSVCAIYEKYCQDNTCRATFQSSTLACQDPDVISFSLGACPGDDKLSVGRGISFGGLIQKEDLLEEFWAEEECSLGEEFTWDEEECILEEEYHAEDEV